MTTTNDTFETTWEAVHRMHAEGRTPTQISRALDITRPSVRFHLGRPEPSRRMRRRCDAGTSSSRCSQCGTHVSRVASSGKVLRCRACLLIFQREQQALVAAGRRRRLLEYGVATGHVPSVRQATTLIGVERSVAAQCLLDTFGPDPRRGYDRRSPRPLP